MNELLSLSQRFEVAKMLRDQKTYLDIAEKTGASTSDHQPCKPFLNYGNDGYDMVFARMASIRDKRSVKTEQKEKPGAARIMSGIDSVPFSTMVLFFFFGRIFFFVQHLIDNALDNCFFQVDIIA